MIGKRFYHCCLFATLLATGTPLAGAVDDGELDPGLLRPPPRSINDITRMLADYRQQDDLVSRLRAVADAPPPSGESPRLFDFYWKRGLAAGELGRVQQQIDDLRLAVGYGQGGSAEYARALRNLSQAERLGGNFAAARRHAEESIRQVPRRAAGQLTAAYAQVVGLAAQVGDFETARTALGQLENTLVALRNGKEWANWAHFWRANHERARGDFFAMSGRHLEAEAAYRKSLRENEQALLDLPGLLAAGREAPSAEMLRQAMESAERTIALALAGQGKLVEAEAMARRALEHTLQRAGRAAPEVGRGLRILAEILGEQGRYEESAKLAEAALAAVLASGAAADSLSALGARRGMLAAQVALGNDHRALAINAEIRGLLAANPGLSAQLVQGDLNVVLALLRTGQAGAAESIAGEMLERGRRLFGEQALATAEARALHAMALADLGRDAPALAGFRAAVPPLLERVRSDADAGAGGTRRQQRLVLVLERYIRLLAEMQAQGRMPAGEDAAGEAFRLADEARGSSVQRALTRSAARAAIRDPQLAELARREQDAQRRADVLNELLGQLLAAAPEQQLPAIQARIRADIETLGRTRSELKQEIGRRFPEYSRLVDPPPVDIAQVQKMLRPGELLLSWYFGRDAGQAWGVAGDGRVRFVQLATDRPQVAAAVAGLRRALAPEAVAVEQIPPFDVAAAHRLYQQLLAPLADLLVGAETLLTVPHGELGQLPLALLVSRPVAQPADVGGLFTGYREVPWLMRQAAIVQLPSVTALASLRRLPPAAGERLPFAGFGDPYFSAEQARQGERASGRQLASRGALHLRSIAKVAAVDSAGLAMLPRLPDTADEVLEIAAALKADPRRDVFLRRDASEQAVFATDLSNRRVVMFATHGLVPGELDGLGQPALALSAPDISGGGGDGLLTQEEILSLRLDADWVVLSACNTAAGEGAGSEAVSGLGRAFFYAGARALLVSNWPVESDAARRLMTDLFRRQAMDPALAKAVALRRAMAGMIDGPGRTDPASGKMLFSYAHPLFWAPFVLVGD